MSEVQLDSNPELAKKFYNRTLEKLVEINVPEETRGDIAEFIVMLVSNNKSPQEIIEELSAISGDSISVEFISTLFQDLEALKNAGLQQQLAELQQQQQQQQQQQFTVGAAPSPFTGVSQFASVDYNAGGPFANAAPMRYNNNNDPNGGFRQRNQRFGLNNNNNGGGIRKHQNNAVRKNFGGNAGNALQLQKALADLLSGKDPTKKKVRCKNFPHCTFKDCKYAHPTRMCFQFPNCPNTGGTCTFLHPGEDDALMAEFEKVKAEAEQRRIENNQKIEQQNGIGLCHKGANCVNPSCKYGHPTRANESNEVNVFEWCANGINCADAGCHKAHPSYKTKEEVYGPQTHYNNRKSNNLAKLASLISNPAAVQQTQEKSLEQCKFGSRCMNPRCKFRHASTSVMCRDGANCTRIDCYFSHPLSQDCKYSINCKNKYCLFKHPPERDEMINKPLVWTADGSNDDTKMNTTNERQFAVAEGEVLEKAPVQEDSSMAT